MSEVNAETVLAFLTRPPLRDRPAVLRYGVAVAACLLAIAARELLMRWFGERFPFITFYPAIIIGAWFGGLGPGLLATAFTSVAVLHYLTPGRMFQIHSAAELLSWTIFIATNIPICLLVESLHRARQRAQDAADAMRAVSEKHAAVLASISDGFVVLDGQGVFTYVNPQAEIEFQARRGQALGRHLFDVFPDLRGTEIEQHYRTVTERRQPVSVERYIEYTGRSYQISGYPAGDGGISVFFRDITALRRAMRAASENELRFRMMADSAPVLIWMSDTTKLCIWFNKPWLEFTGRTMEQESGNGWADGVHPDDFKRCLKTYVDSFDARRPFRMEYRLRRCDGEFRWMLDSGVPLYAADGTFSGYIGSLVDITDRIDAEHSVRESEERLRLSLDAGKLGVWDWDIATNKISWSQRVYELHGVSPDNFDGTIESFASLIHPDDELRVRNSIRDAIERHTPYQIEFRVIWPSDGTTHWLWTEGRAFYDTLGKPMRMIGATTEITERKSAEQERERLLASERAARTEVERSSRLKDEFLANLSHELRTPLNSILGWAQLLRSGRAVESEFQQGLETIERNSRVQAQLIEDLLDMSRVISGKLRLDVQRVDLIPVIDAAIETVRPAADAKGIRLVRVLDPSAGPVWGDPNRLQQIIWNLLSNSIKFTPRGGQVQTLLHRADSHVEIAVTDTGIGIQPDFLPHVFERFRQADSSTTRLHGGLGLGLAIVRHLAELHGGTARVSSEGEGRGATFTVALPLAISEEPVTTTEICPDE